MESVVSVVPSHHGHRQVLPPAPFAQRRQGAAAAAARIAMITAVLSATSALAPYGQPMRAGRPAPLRFCSAPAMVSKEQADAESNARLMAALGVFGDGEEEEAAVVDADEPMDSLYQEDTLIRSKEVPSHMQLDLDDEGNPTLIRFAYVDEPSCIGCTYCADVARNTFYMDDEAGRASASRQLV